MKTFLKLLVAVAAFGFATANAQSNVPLTQGQADAIAKVEAAIATGDIEQVKAAVSEQVAAFPEITAQIVTAAIKAAPGNSALLQQVVYTAAFTAPSKFSTIVKAIKDSKVDLAQGVSVGDLTSSAASGRNEINAINQQQEEEKDTSDLGDED